MAKIIIVDDDPAMVAVLSEVLREHRHEVIPASTPERAFQLVQGEAPDLVLADVEMPEGKPLGLKLLQQVKEHNRSIPVVMITGQGTKERAVQALRAGAQDFVEKPFQIDELVKRVDNALVQQKAVHALEENVELRRQLQEKFRFDSMIGTTPCMESVYRLIERVANTDSTVLILGESGTGKELVARALHYNSRRAAMPFVAVNCSALPEHLLESELFGHRKGAFTGAAFDKVGLFQHADGGTILLDEIGSMASSLQSKLLRFLQDKELRRVGDTDTIKVDVRVLASTNEPLQQKMLDKSFREDLYYRISVIPIQLPALRERTEDIPLLVTHFVQLICQRQGTVTPRFSDEVMEVMKGYRWPGNVRELQNAVERATALCDGGVVLLKDLPERVLDAVSGRRATTSREDDAPTLATQAPAVPREVLGPIISPSLAEKAAGAAQWSRGLPPIPLKEFLHRQEVDYIEQVIQAAGGDKEKAAEMLGISMATLYRKLAAPCADEQVEAEKVQSQV
ncbi:MAG TPA: sigma-54 dependent transcriptional regulator [Verrucomicrobiae bacterium]|nr:sigma-54 dependent transcriptional regulator [Verrucomicrobiae bacterium]